MNLKLLKWGTAVAMPLVYVLGIFIPAHASQYWCLIFPFLPVFVGGILFLATNAKVKAIADGLLMGAGLSFGVLLLFMLIIVMYWQK